nr:Calx-beta domain-containing protein [uncultured Chitinophaga sp.]
MSQITLLKHRYRAVFPVNDTVMNAPTAARKPVSLLTAIRSIKMAGVMMTLLWQLPAFAAPFTDNNSTGKKVSAISSPSRLRATTPAPGGVAGSVLWLRADDPSGNGASWKDYTGNGLVATQTTVASQPTVNAGALNFNYAFVFNGSSSAMAIPNAAIKNVFPFTNKARTVIAVGATGKQVNSSDHAMMLTYGSSGNGVGTYIGQVAGNGMASFGAYTLGGSFNVHAGVGTAIQNVTRILGGRYDGSNASIDLDGVQAGNITGSTWNTDNTQPAWIGRGPANGANPSYWNGKTGEIILYNRVLAATELQQVYSYLGLKYGITVSQGNKDYLASNGAAFWTADATFKSRITGIGRDDATGLKTKQSLNIDGGTITLALGAQVATTNAANTSTITNDLSFLTLADNALDFSYNVTTSTPLNALVTTRMNRVWKVQKSNWADQDITLSTNFTGVGKYLLISSNPAFPSGSITKVIPFNGSTITFNSSDLPATAYFTIGRALKGPGGVINGIAAWYRGDKGLSSAQWNDFSGLDMNIPQPAANLQPGVNQGAANFNPTPTFDGTRFFGKGKVVDAASSVFGNLQVQRLAVFAVGAPNAAATTNTLFSQETNVTDTRILAHVPWSDGNVYFDPPITFRQSAAWGGTYKKMSVWSFTKTPTLITTSRDRNTLINKTGTFNFTGNAGNYAFNIGGTAAGSGVYNGNIPELIVYKDITALTATDQQKIESYLALKYGVTLNQTTPADYLASDGSKMWTGDATYKYNITGIGRDDASALEQKQSVSVDAGIITLALGTQVAATNAANSNSIPNDLSFLVIADNGLTAASYDVNVSTALNPTVTRRMARVWKVQKPNWADRDITLQANVNGSSKFLLISNTDQTFGTITKIIPFSGNAVTLNSSDLPNGAYFTFGVSLTAPGGVFANLNLWMKANDGVLSGDGTKVATWKNVVGNGYNVSTASVADQPVFYSKTASQLLNFNPSVVYKGTEASTNVLRNTTRLFPNTSGFQLVGVGMDRRTTWTGTSGGLLATGPGGNHPVLYVMRNGTNNGWSAFMGSGASGPVVAPAALSTSNAIIYNGGTANANNVQPQIFSVGSLNNGVDANANNIVSWVDGFRENTPLDAARQAEIGNGVLVGSSDDNSTWIGNIPEVLIYDRQLTDAEMAKVNSYLAIKYGVTMDQRTPYNYVATDASVIWNATANAAYKYNIAGIGRDDIQDLRQKQSRSVNGDFQVTIGVGDLAATNDDNTGTFANDKAYLLWGDDNAAVNFRTSVTGNAAVNFRMARVWKVQKSAAMNEVVQIAAPYDRLPNTRETYLIVSDDDTFNGADQFIKLSEITIQGVKHYAAKIALTNGQYFTFASNIKAPGGVGGTSLWLRPDRGTSATSDGAALSTWTDYAADLNNASQPAAAKQPFYVNNPTGNQNFNPLVRFNGTNSVMMLDPNKLPVGKTPRTLFGVGTLARMATGANQLMFAWGDGTPDRSSGLAALAGGVASFIGDQTDISMPGYWTVNVPEQLTGKWESNGMATLYGKGKRLNNIVRTTWNTGTASSTLGGYMNNNYFWDGTIGDIIVFPFDLNDIQRNKVESYLAIKYGFTLDQTTGGDYRATDDNIIWKADPVYKSNIAGIGYDEVEGLEQKQSRSIHPGAILTIALGEAAADNASNTASFDNDKSYMIWGSNTNSLMTTNTNLPQGSCVRQRLAQQWKVQYTNFDPAAKQLMFNFDLNGITYTGTDTRDFTLSIDNDGDGNFATGTITEYKASIYDATKKLVSFRGVSNIPAGAVFTLTTSQPVRVATLVPDGQSQTAASICRDNDWIYFTDPTDATKYIAAIDLNGNTVNMSDFNAALVDVSKTMDNLGANSSADYGIQLMRRLLQIKYTGAPLTVNGGVKLRYFWEPAEQTAAATYLSGTRNVAAAQEWTWFRHTGDIAATLDDLTPSVLQNAIKIVPSGSGTVDGVTYIEFDGLQQFDVFGGVYTANQVVSVRRQQDGVEGLRDGIFSIELPSGVQAPEDLTVEYTMTGMAINGVDYQPLSGQVTLKAGDPAVQLPVLVIDDEVIELPEDVHIELTTVTGVLTGNVYSISSSQRQASLVIGDNDQNKALLGVTKIKDATEPSTNGTYNISLPATVTSSEDITVTYSMTGTATNGTDYTLHTNTVLIPKGVTSIALPVEVIDDKLIEGPEKVLLTLAGGASANFTFTVDAIAAAAEMVVGDDDNTPANQVVSITKVTDAAEPSANGAFLVSLPAGYAAAQPITVNYTISGTAASDKDYQALTGSVVIPAGQNSIPLDVITKDDSIIESNETVVATITSATAPVLGTFTLHNTQFSATVIIADDDNTALNKVLTITKTADAAEPAVHGGYKISLPAGITAAEAVTVTYTMSGAAVNGTDYTNLTGTVVLNPEQPFVLLPLLVKDDKIIEGDETVTATLSGGTTTNLGAFTADPAGKAATLTIADDDNTAASKVLHISRKADAAEPSTHGAFEIGLPQDVTAAGDITVNYTVTGTAANGTDYQSLSGTVTIPAGQPSVALPVTVINDKIIEGNETVITTLNNGTSAAFGAFSIDVAAKAATVTIGDDDNTTANLILNIAKTTDAAEPSANGAFSIALPADYTASEDITINYTVSGTATNGTDYQQLTSPVVLSAGQNSVTLPVVVKDDKIIENNEVVTVTLGNGTSTSFTLAAGSGKSANVTIADDDNTAANKVIVAVKKTDAAEPSANGAFTLQLPLHVTAVEDITVQYSISGTATNGTDYTTLSGTAVIPAGQNGIDVPVVVTDDSILEDDETIIITATGGNSAVFGSYTADASPATVIIKDDDNTDGNKVLRITKTADAAEPSTNGGFKISLPANVTLDQPLTVSYTVGGTATNGTDYGSLSGTVVIPAGQNEVPLPLVVKDDKIIEVNETVIVNISGGTATSYGVFTASSTNGSATVTIADDDNTAANNALTISKAADGAEPATPGSFTINLPAGITASEDITVKYGISGTATPGADYYALSGTVVIAAGQPGETVIIPIKDDKTIEVDETVIVTLNGGASANFTFTGTGAATVVIADDDNTSANRTLVVQKMANSSEPSTQGIFFVRIPNSYTVSEPVTVNYTVSGTATNGVDYVTLSGTMVLPPNRTTEPIDVIPIDDKIIEGTETVTMTLADASSANFPFTVSTTPATVNIADNDNTAANKMVQITKTADAAEPSTNGEFTISLPADVTVAEDMTVHYQVTGTAINGTDYTSLSGSVLIPANTNSVKLPLTVTDDKIVEGVENVLLTLTHGVSANYAFTVEGAAAEAAATITDDDDNTASGQLSIVKTTDAAEPSANGMLTISLPAGVTYAKDVTVNYTVAGTATSDLDYTALSGTVVIAAGQSNVTLTVPVIDDKVLEHTETVIVTLTGGTAAGFAPLTVNTTNASATVNITDNDHTSANKVVRINKTADGAEPATNGAFSISLPADVTAVEAVTVNYTITGTATNGTDYTQLTGTATIPAGSNSAPIAVTVKDDQVIEVTETVIATLNSASATTFGAFAIDAAAATATVNITDNDNIAGNRKITVIKMSHTAEPNAVGKFGVSLPANITSAEPVTVNYTITGTATNGEDYTTLTGTTVIAAGDNKVIVPVEVKDDKIIEGTETVVMTLNTANSASFGFSVGTTPATVNIADDDATTTNRVLSIAKVEDAAEPATNGSFRVSLPNGITSALPVKVSYMIDGSSTAVAGVDYTAITGEVIIPANTNSVLAPVVVTDDQVIEPVETVVMIISGGNDGTFVYTANTAAQTATVYLTDDDFTPNSNVVLVTKVSDAVEGSIPGQFKISLPPHITASEPVTIRYAMGGSATNTDDYTTLGGVAVILPGDNFVLVDVNAGDDNSVEGPEQAVMSLTGASSDTYTFNIMPGKGSATVTIIDANAASQIPVTVAKLGPDAAEPSTNGAFRVSLVGGTSANPVTIGYKLTGAAEAGVDYTITGNVVIPANTPSVDVPVTVIDDKIIEGAEDVVFTVISGSAADGNGNAFIFPPDAVNTATINILDDDNQSANLQLSVAKVADAAEAATHGSFRVSLPADYTASTDITVQFSNSGTATKDDDYTTNTSITIPKGRNSVIIPVTVKDDKIIEPTETVVLTLTSGTDGNSHVYTASGATATASLDITDDDGMAANRQLTIARVTDGSEPATNGQFRISLPKDVTVTEPITVTYAIAGTATNGDDYQPLTTSVVLPANQNNVVVDITVKDDQVIEGEETVQLTLAGGTTATLGAFTGAGSATLVIADDDNTTTNRVLQVKQTKHAAEPATHGNFHVSLPATYTSARDITLQYVLKGTAMRDGDYTVNTIVLPAFSNGVDIPVTVKDDKIIEPTETVVLELTAGEDNNSNTYTADAASATATVNIGDDDNNATNRTLQVIKRADAAEPGTHGAFDILLPADYTASEAITVTYNITGSAVNGTDYMNLSGTATLPANSNSVTVDVITKDDKIIEGDETVIMTLSAGATSTIGAFSASVTPATVTIADDDNTSSNQVLSAVRTADAAEPGTPGEFEIRLPAGVTAAKDITVTYTIAGTATNGKDYTTLTGTVVLPHDNNKITIPVAVIDDQIIEQPETVILQIGKGTSGSFSYAAHAVSGAATLTIADNDDIAANKVLSAGNTTNAAEPATNGNFTINLPLNVTAADDITVQYTLTGAAVNGADYTIDATAIIPAGKNGVDVPVNVTDDKIIEGDETVVMTLQSGQSALFGHLAASTTNSVATVTIADDDNIAGNRQLHIVKENDAAEPATDGKFMILLPSGVTAAEDITVNYTVAGTAANGTDYTDLTGTVVIPANQPGVELPVIVKDDQVIEENETVIATLAGGNSAKFAFTPDAAAATATVTILDDENTTANRVISITRDGDAAEPSTNGAFVVSLPANLTASAAVTVNYTIGGTATAGADYTALTGTIVIPQGQNRIIMTVSVTDDQIMEETENVTATITHGAAAGLGSFTASSTAGNAAVLIADNDNVAANKVLSVVKNTDAAEPGTNGSFTISLPAGVTLTDDVVVNYTLSGTAGNGTDYTMSSHATILAGQPDVTVPVTVTDDKIIEGNETVVLTLTDGKSLTFGNFTASATNGAATVTITDDDDIAANKLLRIVQQADGAEPATNGRFMIQLPKDITVAEDVTVNYTIAGTAANGTDYAALTGTIVIPAGQPGVELPVTVTDDQIIEENETVIATLTGGASAKFAFTPDAAAATATVTILDNENTAANRVISIIKGGDAAEPATNGSFVVSLPANLTASAAVTVNYTIGGTATAGADYQTLTGTVVIPQGQNNMPIPVTVIDDRILETAETVIASITNGNAAGLGAFSASGSAGNATVLIADNDNIPANKVLSVVKTADAAEPGTNGAFTISLPAGVTLTDDVVVNYTVAGTAVNGTDYTIAASTTIPAGQPAVTVPVTVIDDRIIEGDETVMITLKDGKSAGFGDFTASTTNGAATVTIVDDEDLAVNRMLSASKVADAAEPGTNGAFRISLPAGITAAEAINLNYTVNGSAVNGKDYTMAGTAVIAAGAESATIPVNVIDDKIIEGAEAVVLTLNGGVTATVGNFTANSSSAVATMTIADDDDAATNLVLNVTATRANAAEPATHGEVTIALPAGYTATVPVTVQYTTGGTAASGADYKALSGTVTIPAGDNSITVPVEVIDNKIQDGTRTVVFTLTGGTAGSWTFTPAAGKTATVNISDDDIQRFDTWKTVALPAGNTSGMAHPNEMLTYTIHVRNTGNIPLAQVTITDPVPANTIYVSGGTLNGNVVTFTLSNLAPGATATATLIVKTPASLDGVRSITNTAQVSDGTTTKPTGGCDPAAPGCNGQPGTVIGASNIIGDLSITKTVMNPPTGIYRMGQDITYSVKVKSTGTQVFTNVVVEDLLPANLEMPKAVNVQHGQVDKANGKVVWTIPSLPAGQEVEMTIVCRILEGGDIINRVTVKASEPETNSTNNSAEAAIKADGADITFPNVFTPNGDGKNERFIIGGLEKYPGSAIYIYNRWGSMVYQSKDYRNNWDGSQLNEGTYYYVLEVRKPEGVVRYKGWVQILR